MPPRGARAGRRGSGTCGWPSGSPVSGRRGSRERRAAVRPRPLGLDLGGEREQGRPRRRAADQGHRPRQPARREARRDRHRRLAGVVPDRGEAKMRLIPSRVRSAPLPCPAADLDRRLAHRRRDQDVELAPAAVDLLGVRGRGRGSRCAITAAGVGPSEPAEPAGARLEPLGVRDRLDVLADAAEVAGDEVVAGRARTTGSWRRTSWPSERRISSVSASPALTSSLTTGGRIARAGSLGDRDPQPPRRRRRGDSA